MKRKSLNVIHSLIIFTILIASCREEIIPESTILDTKIEHRVLNSSELQLKSSLEETAKIIAEVGKDNDVLLDIVNTIKKQPREMEDKVKFAHLMCMNGDLKSLDVLQGSGKFADAFKQKIYSTNLKSSSNLIDFLIKNGIEVTIPYPIEDYPEGTEIVVTSHPIDNEFENIGYFLGKPNETITANEELTKKYPVIIVNVNQTNEKQIEKSLKITQDKLYEKSTSNYIDPLSVWNKGDQYRFQIYIGEVYIKEDGISGLFVPDGRVVMTNTGVAFSSLNSYVSIPIAENQETFGQRFPRKYEGYAQDGYGKGWLSMHTVFMEDWHPGITDKPFVAFMDHPTRETTKTETLTVKILAELSSELLPGLVLKPEGTVSNSLTTKITYSDLLYKSKIYYRSTYLYDYNRSGDTWSSTYGNHYRYYQDYPELGNRPALKLTEEFFYTTYCRVIPK